MHLLTLPIWKWWRGRVDNANLWIASSMGSNPVRDKPLFPQARNFTLITQYWLIPGTDSRVFIY